MDCGSVISMFALLVSPLVLPTGDGATGAVLALWKKEWKAARSPSVARRGPGSSGAAAEKERERRLPAFAGRARRLRGTVRAGGYG